MRAVFKYLKDYFGRKTDYSVFPNGRTEKLRWVKVTERDRAGLIRLPR